MTGRQHRPDAGERAALSALVAIIAVFLAATSIVVAEGGRRLSNISRAEDLASEAARAAASSLDVNALALGESRIDASDMDGARAAASRLLDRSGDDVRFRIEVSPTGRSVVVEVVVEADSVVPGFDVRGYGRHRAQVVQP